MPHRAALAPDAPRERDDHGWGSDGRRAPPGSCCSRARAAWARPPRRRPPRCAAPTPACARSSCRPTRRTRWPTPSTRRSARWPRPWPTTCGPSSSTRRTAWRTPGPRSSATSLEVFHWAGVEGIEAEELSVVPGLDEVFALTDIKTHATSGDWDVRRRRLRADGRDDPPAVAARRPRLVHGARVPDGPPGQQGGRRRSLARVTQPAGGRRRRVRGHRALLRPARRGARAAHRRAPHQRAPGREPRAHGHRRGPAHLHLPLAVRLPRRRGRSPTACCPTRSADPWFARWKAAHAEHLAAIEEGFAPVPVLRVPLQPTELVGLDAPAQLRRRPLRRRGPDGPVRAPRAHAGAPAGRPAWCSRSTCRSPTATSSSWAGRATSCWCASGPYRRAVVLPDTLRRRSVTDARLRNGRLTVTFDSAGPGDRSNGDASAAPAPPPGAVSVAEPVR